MKYSIILFVILFMVTFLMHKPFDVHASQNEFLQRIHYLMEDLFTIQLMILLNNWLQSLK